MLQLNPEVARDQEVMYKLPVLLSLTFVNAFQLEDTNEAVFSRDAVGLPPRLSLPTSALVYLSRYEHYGEH
jgi:hypothetical protein